MEVTKHLETRIRWLLVAFTLMISLLFACLLLAYAWVVEDNVFNRLVASEARYIKARFAVTQQVVSPRVPFMRLHQSWAELPEHIRLLRQESPERIEFPTDEGGTLHLKTIKLGENQWILAADVGGLEVSRDYMPRAMQWIAFALLGVYLLTFLISRYLTRQIVRPITTIADKVAAHRDGEDLVFEEVFKPDEIGYLASTVKLSFNRLQQALKRESQFTRDVSHELRTPTAVLKILAEKLQNKRQLSYGSQQRLAQSVLQLERTVDVLLALAREESLKMEALTLRDELEFCIINHPVFSSDEGARLDLNFENTTPIRANKNLLHLLIYNLLDNAVNHASSIKLSIHANQNELIFSNPSQAVIDKDVFCDTTKSESSDGLGLGLNLVKRICEKMHWGVSAQLHPGFFSIHITFN